MVVSDLNSDTPREVLPPRVRGSAHHDAGNAEFLGNAMHWLLESSMVDEAAKVHFWHVADGVPCDCVEEGRVSRTTDLTPDIPGEMTERARRLW